MKLDKSQQKAVDHYKGQAMAVAGAGSGKTKVVTERIAKLIERGEKPESILAFTFTNAAADEMKKRLLAIIGDVNVGLLNIGTMHSQMNRILRKNIEFWKPGMMGYEIMDDYGQRKLVTEALKATGLPENEKTNIANSIKAIANIKNAAISMEDVMAGKVDGMLKEMGVQAWFVDFFQTYETLRYRLKKVGFDDMLWDTYFLLSEMSNILNTYANLFNFILVDEFQDTNQVQFGIIKMLQSKHKNLFVVADPRQAIYGFRGADVKLALEFLTHFPEGNIIELEYNYRCASNIVEIANDLIAKAGYPFARTKFTKVAGKIQFVGSFESDDDEALAITEEIKLLNQDGVKYGDITVLARTNAQSRPFEEKFIRNKIPYRSVEGSFYDSANVKDMVSYLELAIGDNMEAFKRVYNRPNRFLGKIFYEEFVSRMKHGGTIMNNLRCGGFAKPFMNKGAGALAMDLMMIRNHATSSTPGKVIQFTRKLVAYDDWLRKNEIDALSRIEIINELESNADTFPTVLEYLEFVRQITAAQKNKDEFDAVQIMTVHRSKGQEFPIVFVAGVSDGILPHARSEDVEEERRICYVALTRAVDRLYVSYPLTRFNKPLSPSPFLAEMELDKYTGVSWMPAEEQLTEAA